MTEPVEAEKRVLCEWEHEQALSSWPNFAGR